MANELLTRTHAELATLTKSRVLSPHFFQGWSGMGHPVGVVVHYTGGGHGTAAKWFRDVRAKASAHFVIGRPGNLVQCVSITNRAWHAGRSRWDGRRNCNDFMLGIELENWGPLVKRQSGYACWPPLDKLTRKSKYLRRFSGGDVVPVPNHPEFQYWEGFTSAQIETLIRLSKILVNGFNIPRSYYTGHENVSPGRKLDPGPAFPWAKVLGEVCGWNETVNTLTEDDDESDEVFLAMMDQRDRFKDRAGGV